MLDERGPEGGLGEQRGVSFQSEFLTRPHEVPASRGGAKKWGNVGQWTTVAVLFFTTQPFPLPEGWGLASWLKKKLVAGKKQVAGNPLPSHRLLEKGLMK